eukprot:sb/3463851/
MMRLFRLADTHPIAIKLCVPPGPSKFAFSKQPTTTSVDTGTTVTLSCEAGGRTGITYQWYSLAAGFNVPPQDSDKIDIQTSTNLEVSEGTYTNSMFQCMATAGEESIFSDVATVTFNIPASTISFSGTVTTDDVSTSEAITDNDAWVFTLKCNKDSGFDPDTQITSGSVYSVKWYKGSDEVADNNKWIYTSAGENKLVANGQDNSVTPTFDLEQYSLVIFNIKTTDAATYTCKAINTAGGSVLLGTVTISSVGKTISAVDIGKSKTSLAAGYTVQALNSDGTIKTIPSVGDTVLLSCGGVCKPGGSTSNSISYKWTLEGDQNTILSTDREYSATMPTTSSLNIDLSRGKFRYLHSNSGSPYGFSHTSGTCAAQLLSSDWLKYRAHEISANQTTVLELHTCARLKTVRASTTISTKIPLPESPTAALTASPTTYRTGEAATLTCTITGYPISSVQISLDGGSTLTTTEVSSTVYTATIGSFSVSDAGKYTCSVSIEWYKTDNGVAQTETKTSDLTLEYGKYG